MSGDNTREHALNGGVGCECIYCVRRPLRKRIRELETENVRLRDYIKHAECYGDWCGKSPTNKSSGLCQACEARKALEQER